MGRIGREAVVAIDCAGPEGAIGGGAQDAWKARGRADRKLCTVKFRTGGDRATPSGAEREIAASGADNPESVPRILGYGAPEASQGHGAANFPGEAPAEQEFDARRGAGGQGDAVSDIGRGAPAGAVAGGPCAGA